MEYTVISIGTLSKNPLWQERVAVRTSHSTTTLIRSESAVILVDPSLPGQILEARLFERTGLKPDAITHVFLTNLKPVHRRGLDLFPKAVHWAAEMEIEIAQQALAAAARHISGETEGQAKLTAERQLLAAMRGTGSTCRRGRFISTAGVHTRTGRTTAEICGSHRDDYGRCGSDAGTF